MIDYERYVKKELDKGIDNLESRVFWSIKDDLDRKRDGFVEKPNKAKIKEMIDKLKPQEESFCYEYQAGGKTLHVLAGKHCGAYILENPEIYVSGEDLDLVCEKYQTIETRLIEICRFVWDVCGNDPSLNDLRMKIYLPLRDFNKILPESEYKGPVRFSSGWLILPVITEKEETDKTGREMVEIPGDVLTGSGEYTQMELF